MKKFIVVPMLFGCFIFVIAAARAQLDPNAPWPMFHRNKKHTGLSSDRGPLAPLLSWSYTTGLEIYSSPAIGRDGRIYIGSQDNSIYALLPNGQLIWSYWAGAAVESVPAIDSAGNIYAGSWNSILYAIRSDGTLRWSYDTGSANLKSSPAIGDDGKIYTGTAGNDISSFNTDGSLRWSYKAGAHVDSSPAIGNSGVVYVGSHDNNIYAINSIGSFIWSYEAENDVTSSPAVGSDGRIYIGSSGLNNMLALKTDGSLSWSYENGAYHIYSSPAIGEHDEICIAAYMTGTILSLTSNGSLNWSYDTDTTVSSSPAIDSEGRIYIGSSDNRVYALNSDGSFDWSYATDDEVTSSPAIGSDGRIYIGSRDNSVYCLGPTVTPTPTPTITSTPTPEVTPTTPLPTATVLPNYINLTAGPASVSPGSPVTLSWSCDFSAWNYRGVPVNIYLAAIRDPNAVDAPSSVGDTLGGGEVYLWGPGMGSIYRYSGSVGAPTYSNVSFPPVALSNSINIATPTDHSFAGDYVFATAFIRSDGAGFVRDDGLPVENSNLFQIQ